LPEKDDELGKSEENPAYSCADIMKYGDQKKEDGKYFIQLGDKNPFEVYCDMNTDEGGWTLFFSYSH